MFRFVCRGWNCAPYINACVNSLLAQTITDWRATLIIDPSPDDTVEMARGVAATNKKFNVIVNDKRMGVCANMYKGIAGCGAVDEDIVCILDLDDVLYDKNAIETVKKHYTRHPNILCTYGSFVLGSKGRRSDVCSPYRKGDKIRQCKWRASHLKTFKFKVFKTISKEYFMHNAHWGYGASDMALMFAVIERIGLANTEYIEELIYWYRDKSPITCERGTQKKYGKIWRAKPPLERLF